MPRITVNAEPRTLPDSASVADLIRLLGKDPARLAVEVNRDVVPRAEHAARTLADGDAVEIVTLVGGGSPALDPPMDKPLKVGGFTFKSRLFTGTGKARDASGNVKLEDIGPLLRDRIGAHFARRRKEVTIRYIDPSYVIRSQPANSFDAQLCLALGQTAVHAGMTGRTGMFVGVWNQQGTHVPIALESAVGGHQLDHRLDVFVPGGQHLGIALAQGDLAIAGLGALGDALQGMAVVGQLLEDIAHAHVQQAQLADEVGAVAVVEGFADVAGEALQVAQVGHVFKVL